MGYIVSVKILDKNQQAFLEQMEATLGKFQIKEKRSINLLIQIFKVENLKGLFDFMERGKSDHGITDYSISQTTLDDVFISFAKKQSGNEFLGYIYAKYHVLFHITLLFHLKFGSL